MRTIIVGECSPDNTYRLTDPDAPREAEFEMTVVRALSCVFPEYLCVTFGGSFEYDTRISRPDLALVAKDFSHWFIVEVELTSHSFSNHVLPQVRAFQYGNWQPDCVSSLTRGLNIGRGQIETLLRYVPRSVAVVANNWKSDWSTALAALQTQLISISVFSGPDGREAFEVNGKLEISRAHIGFATYFATDRGLRLPASARLPSGEVQISDPNGSIASWRIERSAEYIWLSKIRGTPDLADGETLQLIDTVRGGLSLRYANAAVR